MSKKILSVVLALALVCSCFAVSAFAMGGMGYEDADATYTQAWELGTPVDNGNGIWTVDVKLTANYSVGAIQFTVENTNNAGAVLSAVAAGSAIPETWEADVAFSKTTGKVMINANPSTDAVYAFDASAGVVVATLTYTVADGETATINIKNDPKTATTPGGTLIAARMSDGNVVTGTAIVGQTVTSVGSSQNLGAVASVPPVLQVIDGAAGVIYTEYPAPNLNEEEGTTCDGYIFGWDSEGDHSVDEIFEVVGDGTMNIVANDEGHECASGTMVQVLDLEGTVVAEYVVIIFGDVNGDSYADSNDASAIELHEGYEFGDSGQLPTYLQFAADVNLDGAADSNDASVVELHEGYEFGDNGRLNIEEFIANYQ